MLDPWARDACQPSRGKRPNPHEHLHWYFLLASVLPKPKTLLHLANCLRPHNARTDCVTRMDRPSHGGISGVFHLLPTFIPFKTSTSVPGDRPAYKVEPADSSVVLLVVGLASSSFGCAAYPQKQKKKTKPGGSAYLSRLGLLGDQPHLTSESAEDASQRDLQKRR